MGHEFASCWAETLDLADSLQALIPDPIGENLIARLAHRLDQGLVSVDTPAAYARGFVYHKSSLVKTSGWVAISIGRGSL